MKPVNLKDFKNTTDSHYDLITFNTNTFEYLSEDDEARIWQTMHGDIVSLHHYPIPPDIDADFDSINSVRQFYRQAFASYQGAIIQVDFFAHPAGNGILLIGKLPQNPSGMTYLGTLTIPFRDCSYVIKMTCSEHGTTGIRDNVVFMANSQQNLGGVDDMMADWGSDPYDPQFHAELLCNKSEAEIYDEQFPDHPLSRLRFVMPVLQASLKLDPVLLAYTPFVGVPATEQKKNGR